MASSKCVLRRRTAELANRIGSHREAVTREMGALSKAGIISYGRRVLVIVDLARLEQVRKPIDGWRSSAAALAVMSDRIPVVEECSRI